jgi:hypothetical protein
MGDGFKLWPWHLWRKKPAPPRMTAEEVEKLLRDEFSPEHKVGPAFYCEESRCWHATLIRRIRDGDNEWLDEFMAYVYDETGKLDLGPVGRL